MGDPLPIKASGSRATVRTRERLVALWIHDGHGNKRTAWVTGRVFLADNGLALDFAALDAIQVMEGVAAGRITETKLALWLRSRLRT